MKIEKIITMASGAVKLHFLAMERSLRATGCTLPLWVIPFRDEHDTFELPKGAHWWQVPPLLNFLKESGYRGGHKYQTFTTDHYQFADTDICFLRNPEKVLEPHSDFVVADPQMFASDWAVSDESRSYFERASGAWRLNVFCAGQYASEKGLEVDQLISLMRTDKTLQSCLKLADHDQPGVNLIRSLAGWPITNLMMPPYSMASTWAADYLYDDFEKQWKSEETKPYLLHWAGVRVIGNSSPADRLFLEFLTQEERAEFLANGHSRVAPAQAMLARLRSTGGRVRRALHVLQHGHDHAQCAKMAVRDSMRVWF